MSHPEAGGHGNEAKGHSDGHGKGGEVAGGFFSDFGVRKISEKMSDLAPKNPFQKGHKKSSGGAHH